MRHRARVAAGPDGPADALAEGHQQKVDLRPPFHGHPLPEFPFGLFRRAGFHKPQAVRDPVHMGVHADGGFAEPLAEYQVGGFPAHAGQGQEFLQRVGHPAAVLAGEVLASLAEVLAEL